MPRSRELRGVVVPDVDDRAVKRNVERPLSRTMDRVGRITPTLNLDGIRNQVSNLFGGGGGGGAAGGGLGRDSVQVAQLDALDDIKDILRRQDGGGGRGGGLLTGLGLGRALGGGGAALGLGAAGTAAGLFGLAGGAWKGTEMLNEEVGMFSNEEISNAIPGGIMTGFPKHLARGSSSLLGLSGDIGERLGLVENADEFEQSLKRGMTSAADTFLSRMEVGLQWWTEDVPEAIRSLRFPKLPDLSNLQLPGPVRRAVDVFDQLSGGGGMTSRTVDLSERASDPSLSFSERRLAQGALGNRRRQGESDTVTVESPILDIDEIRIDGRDILNDLQQKLDQKLSELEREVSKLEDEIKRSGL